MNLDLNEFCYDNYYNEFSCDFTYDSLASC